MTMANTAMILTQHVYTMRVLRVGPGGLYLPPTMLAVEATCLEEAYERAAERAPRAIVVAVERDWRDYT